jgi:hypothetical protein
MIFNKDLQRENIIRAIRAIAAANGGTPPGEKRFRSETGIGPHEWRYRIWRNWSEALTEAGFEPREWTTRYDDVALLSQIASLARRLGSFPNTTELQFESANNPSFPGYKSIKRRWTITELASALRGFAADQDDDRVATYCDEFLATPERQPKQSAGAAQGAKVELGYVYLMSYGKDCKIGRTSTPGRRARQVQIELPDETILVHAILTDDPVGVEAYWHRRFAGKRGNGEWFRLSPRDIAAFKKWTKIA